MGENYPDGKSNEASIASGGDHFENIQLEAVEGSAIAIGREAQATVYHGLSLDEVAQLVVKLKHEAQPVVWDGRIPYLGLTAFRESDAQFFFGREMLVEDLLARVKESNFIVIAGPSGSGKSSVARAGLFHALRQGKIERSDTWLLGTMQPKGDPIEQLAIGIERMVKRPKAADYTREQALTNPLALSEQLETLLSDDPRQRCVLLVDQFEEVFTQTKNEMERAAFIGLLTTAAQGKDGRATIILSLRSDFVSQCAGFPELRALMSKQFQLVGAMEPQDLTKAITLPALEVGAEIDPALVKQIMDDMKGEPGALPLMSFALRDLFEAEKSSQGQPMDMTLPEYLNRGGIEQALERHANQVFANFSAEQQSLAETIFSKLIEVGQGRVDTRRTATYQELVPSGINEKAVTEVVGNLAREGVWLLTTSGTFNEEAVATGTDIPATVTIAHEKLIDAWPWLRRLVDENREMISLVNLINEDAREWEEKKDDSYLYRGGRLVQVEENLNQLQPQLDVLSEKFVQASLKQRQNELKREAERRQREIEQERALAEAQRIRAEEAETAALGMRRRRNVAVTFAVGALVLAVLAFLLFQQSNQNANEAVAAKSTSDSNSELASTREFEAIAAQETAVFEADRADTNLVAANTAEAAAVTEAERALESAALASTAEAKAIAQSEIAFSQALASSSQSAAGQDPIESLLLAIEAGKTAETALAMDALNRQLPGFARPLGELGHEDTVRGAAWNGDESRILTWSDDGKAKVWDANTSGSPLLTLTHEAQVLGAAWNGNESLILTWGCDVTNSSGTCNSGTAKVWDATTPGDPLLTLPNEGSVLGAAWNEGESRILTWGSDGTTRVWDAVNPGNPLLTLTHVNWVNGAAWNRDESHILTWSRDAVRVWDADTPGDPLLTLTHEVSVEDAVWNEAGDRILAWSRDGTVVVWDAADTGDPLLRLSNEHGLLGAAWNSDENRILTWGQDNTARVWDGVSPGNPLLTLTHEDWVSGAVWNWDDSRVLTWSRDGKAKVWDSVTPGDPLLTLDHELVVSGAAWNRDESQILTWSGHRAWVWDAVNPGDPLLTLAHEDWVRGAAWNEERDRIITWSLESVARVWDVASHRNPFLMLKHAGGAKGAIWNRDETRILSWGCDEVDQFIDCISSSARVWNTNAPDIPLLTLSLEGEFRGAVWNGDESRILTWGCDEILDGFCYSGVVMVWDVDAANNPILTFRNNGSIEGAAWNSDESRILTWGCDQIFEEGVCSSGFARVWDASTHDDPLLTLSHELQVLGAAWNGDESRILTWGQGDIVRVWDAVVPGDPLLMLTNEEWVRGAVWNEDDSRVLVWGDNGYIWVWDAASPGEPIWSLTDEAGFGSTVLGAAWNGDESRILAWSQDESARVWDVADPGKPLLTLLHNSFVYGAGWNGDESRILTWSYDGKTKVWDAKTGERLFTLAGDGSAVTFARWNQDESRILFGTRDGLIRIYYTSTAELAELACEYTTRNLTWDEWQLYFPGQAYRQTCEQWPVHPSVPESAR